MVFSPDKNIGAAALAKQYDLTGKLLVHSIFHTFQGEMPFAGRSAVFLRLGGCNRGAKTISCLFCDTAFEAKDSQLLSVENVAMAIRNLQKKGTELLVITGGEPLMQQDALVQLFKQPCLPDYIQIETNGDYALSPENKTEFYKEGITVVCSPKAWDGKERPFRSLSLDPKNISAYRFLMSATDKEYQSVPKKILNNCLEFDNPLYLSPITVYYPDSTKEERNKGWCGTSIDVQATIANYQHTIVVANDLLNNGISVRLSSQTHLMHGIA